MTMTDQPASASTRSAEPARRVADATFWRPFVWAGIGAPLFFALVFTLDGALMPSYSSYNEAISYLEVGPLGWIQRLNFILLGLLLVGFARAYAERMRGAQARGWVRTTTTLLTLSALGWIVAGLFAPNPYLAPQMNNLHAYLHQLSFIIVFLPFALGSVVAGIAGLLTRGWRVYGVYALINGLVLLVPPIGSLSYLIDQSFIGDPNSPGGGLFNRVALAVFFAWYIITAIILLRRGRSATTHAV